jgi:hypothetical protein
LVKNDWTWQTWNAKRFRPKCHSTGDFCMPASVDDDGDAKKKDEEDDALVDDKLKFTFLMKVVSRRGGNRKGAGFDEDEE